MRIFITGPTGSGKSTLANRLSATHGIPCYELDNIHWIRDPDGDRRRGPEERLALLQEIVSRPDWIIEGVQFKWADPAIEEAERIIVIDPGQVRNVAQIGSRFIKQKIGLETSKYRVKFRHIADMIGWFRDYHKGERSMLFDKLRPYEDKTLVVGSSSDRRISR